MHRTPLVTAILLAFTAAPASAWNKAGHMVTGAIAFDALKAEHPETIAAVLDLLKQHPQYADVLKDRIESVRPENRDRYAFMVMARWADDIRDNRAFHKGPWHYVNFPIVDPADEATFKPPGPAKPNLLTAIKENGEIVRSDKPAADKAIALCWTFHLVGDAHQPLHATAYFSRAQWPKGEKGGNDFHIRVRADRAVINMHTLWDGLILGTATYQDAGSAAIELRKRAAFSKDEMAAERAVTDPEKWAQESYKIAVEVAYQNRTLKGGDDRTEGPALPAGYTDAAKAVAERRIVLAGYRLADSLARAFGAAGPASKNSLIKP